MEKISNFEKKVGADTDISHESSEVEMMGRKWKQDMERTGKEGHKNATGTIKTELFSDVDNFFAKIDEIEEAKKRDEVKRNFRDAFRAYKRGDPGLS